MWRQNREPKRHAAFAIEPFDYDWRKPLAESARALASRVSERLTALQDSGRPMAILAVSSGAMLLSDSSVSNQLESRGVKAVVLGNPQAAAGHLRRILDGSAELLKLLEFVAGRNPEQLAAIFKQLPGLSEMSTSHPEVRKEFSYILGRDPAGEPDLEAEKLWFANVRHGNLADHPPIFDAIRDLLTVGKTERLSKKRFPSHTREAIPRLYPSAGDLFDAAFDADSEPALEPPLAIHAFVTHGHLRNAKFPIVVGHYRDDVIVSAEKVLDEQLGGRLTDRFSMDRYPGPDGTNIVVEASGSKPTGALIIGLGVVGEISAQKVRNGVASVAIDHALYVKEKQGAAPDEPLSIGISSVLLGTYGGNALSVRNSIAAILDGVVQANRTLRSRNLSDRIRIDQIEIVELYEDLAIQASHELAQLEEGMREYADDQLVLDAERYMRRAPGGQFHRPGNPYQAGWWRRIAIKQDKGKFSSRP